MDNNETLFAKFTSKLEDYQFVVGKNTIDELKMLGKNLEGKSIQNINSTYSGGGVAEILMRLVPLLNQIGVDTRWDIIHGTDDFFEVTKKFHNALHGKIENISDDDYALFSNVSRRNLEEFEPRSDIIFIHDPQPIMLIEKKEESNHRWIWRCHIDVSNPDPKLWNFLRSYVTKYDATVFSAPNFSRVLPNRQFLISPSIDPLSDKNRDLTPQEIKTVLDKYHLDPAKPMIVQISRFDYLKDPVGVIKAFEMVRRSIDCQLILAGGTATDDPESEKVLEEVREHANGKPDIKILLIPPGSDIEINALQRAAAVILQKSLKEGFGLTISEALWKKKPVVASAVGGIPLQIKNKLTGLLCYSIEGAAFAIKQLISNPEYASWLAKNGHSHVKQNFLITRHLKEYLLLFTAMDTESDIIYL